MTPTRPTEKVLFVDIETFPILGYAWTVYEANLIRVVEPMTVCCFSAKWKGGKHITKALPDYKGYRPGHRDDRKLMQDLWDLLDKAEVVVAHNGDKFDVRHMNARFAKFGMKPPSPYKTVDTLKVARKAGAFYSNRLKDLGQYLEIGTKLDTGGADLWFDCMAGKRSAWQHMKRYNIQDVVLLENLYERLLPWMPSHPNLATDFGPGVCTNCGSTQLHKRGYAYTTTTKYQRYQCMACGKWLRDGESLVKKEDKPFVSVR